ncbi:MAG: UV DNA damage repair endonuclease UvsE [Bacillota bacterium]|nr:UV DNA damage repair endonuclease UvsE [Bacillota bacterium]
MELVLGYACLNTTIPYAMKTLRLATYEARGNEYQKELVLNNLRYLKACLLWNEQHHISFFRVSSDLVPLATHPRMTFAWWEDADVLACCQEIKQFAARRRMRLSMHPGQYTLLNSPREDVVHRSIEDLVYHQQMAERLGVTDLIIHVGGLYGNRKEALDRWTRVYQGLPTAIRQRLRLENDEKLFSIEDVLLLAETTGIPAVLDLHHHRILPSLDTVEALRRVFQTWKGIDDPKLHLSSGKSSRLDPRHHEFIHPEDYNETVVLLAEATGSAHQRIYLMLEAKQKEQAVIRLQP